MTTDLHTDAIVPSGALAGMAPVTTGKRVFARVLDTVVPLLPYPLVLVGAGAASPDSGGISLVVFTPLLLVPIFSLFTLYTLVRGAATAGQYVLGLRHVSVVTGTKASGAAFLKLFVEGMVAAFTFGLSYIASGVTIRPPLNQNWVDRMAGVVLIDIKRGRAPGTPVVESQAVPAAPTAPVAVSIDEPHDDIAHRSTALSSRSAAALTGGGATLRSADPVIQATPWSTGQAQEAHVGGTAVAGHAPVVRERVTDPAPLDHTVVSAGISQPTSDGYRLVLDNGRTVEVRGAIVLGRDPVAPSGVGEVETVAVPDAARSISKTHVAVGITDGDLWVRDLRSTNGVRVARRAGDEQQIDPGQPYPLSLGDRVLFGDRSFEVTRG